MVIVRKQLDERGLFSKEAFDKLWQKASAKVAGD